MVKKTRLTKVLATVILNFTMAATTQERVRFPDERPEDPNPYQRYESRRSGRPAGRFSTEACMSCNGPCKPEFRRCRPCEIQRRPVHKCRYCENRCRGSQCRDCHKRSFLCQADRCFRRRSRDAKFCRPCAAKQCVNPRGDPLPQLPQPPLPPVQWNGAGGVPPAAPPLPPVQPAPLPLAPPLQSTFIPQLGPGFAPSFPLAIPPTTPFQQPGLTNAVDWGADMSIFPIAQTMTMPPSNPIPLMTTPMTPLVTPLGQPVIQRDLATNPVATAAVPSTQHQREPPQSDASVKAQSRSRSRSPRREVGSDAVLRDGPGE